MPTGQATGACLYSNVSRYMEELYEALRVMSGFDRPWFVAGGWAIELYLGRVSRAHKDVDIAVFREDQLELQRHLAGWRLCKADGGELRPWVEGEFIRLPVNTIWAWRPGSERGDDQADLEFLLDERAGEEWRGGGGGLGCVP